MLMIKKWEEESAGPLLLLFQRRKDEAGKGEGRRETGKEGRVGL